MEFELIIHNDGIPYTPAVEEGISLDLERSQAGKLTFHVIQDDVLNITEGNTVSLRINGQDMFYGFIFSKQRDKSNIIQVTAYDQMRYLKNKDTYQYLNKTASEVIHMIAEKFRLSIGEIEDTKYVIPKKVEDNQTLLDIILSALDETLIQTKNIFVLYDDFGKLTLKNIENMRTNLLIQKDTGEDFDYKTSIDERTYNLIKLAYNNEETGKLDIYSAQNSESMNNWGILQYYETLNDPSLGKSKADALLAYYNRKSRSLQIKGAFGDPQIKAGSSVVVNLNLGDITLSNYMIVNKVKHTFQESYHTMDLSLIGGDFFG